MAKDRHGNRLDNSNLYHLYLIYDFERREIYKFGISDKPINEHHSSARLEEQIKLYNKVADMPRFSGSILIQSILGRRAARLLEDASIHSYKKKYGRFPRGNEGHVFLKMD